MVRHQTLHAVIDNSRLLTREEFETVQSRMMKNNHVDRFTISHLFKEGRLTLNKARYLESGPSKVPFRLWLRYYASS